jgi:hypothetical protein
MCLVMGGLPSFVIGRGNQFSVRNRDNIEFFFVFLQKSMGVIRLCCPKKVDRFSPIDC